MALFPPKSMGLKNNLGCLLQVNYQPESESAALVRAPQRAQEDAGDVTFPQGSRLGTAVDSGRWMARPGAFLYSSRLFSERHWG